MIIVFIAQAQNGGPDVREGDFLKRIANQAL
jgi:hypothetical protein